MQFSLHTVHGFRGGLRFRDLGIAAPITVDITHSVLARPLDFFVASFEGRDRTNCLCSQLPSYKPQGHRRGAGARQTCGWALGGQASHRRCLLGACELTVLAGLWTSCNRAYTGHLCDRGYALRRSGCSGLNCKPRSVFA